ncbi:hypothetical protein FBU30_009794 [Linnemannia zychae]|nr:hypothetical protein FBU30_009794 [Linnemannia zychae]
MQGNQNSTTKTTKVLIVGAGLGGLTLAMILQKAGIPYEVYERADEARQLGSGITLNATIAPLLRQLNLMDEFVSLSKLVTSIQVANENRTVDFALTAGFENAMEKYVAPILKLYGADTRLIPRPVLHDLFMRQIPKERVHMSTKIVKVEQDANGVRIYNADGSVAYGDILVGADGAHSTVRQNIYVGLKEEGKLPPEDDVPLPFNIICLVGQTKPLSPNEIPLLAKKDCQFIRTAGDNKPYAWNTFTTAQNTIAWSVVRFLDGELNKDDDAFRNSEWGAESAESMYEQVRDFPIMAGDDKKLTIGDLIDWTPKGGISKVMLEEKVFQTWYSGRTVLMGDACHKFNPSGGAGAGNAMHDAVVLANYIYALPQYPSVEEIDDAFKAYKAERIEWVEAAFKTSQMAQTLVAKGIKPMIIRFLVRYMPDSMNQRASARVLAFRPQLSFLPLDETPSIYKPAPQASLHVNIKKQSPPDSAQ